MDEFLNLNWSKKYPKQLRTRGDVYSAAFSDDECDVYVCHMKEIDPQYYERYRNQSEIIQQTPPKKDATGKVSPRTVATENSPQKDNELHLFRKFPTKSKMDEEIHMSCIRYLKSLEDPDECAESQINHSDQEKYLSCEEIRKQEKTEFYEFVKNYFMTHLRQRILKIDVGMENILIEIWQRDVEDVKKKQQQNYQLQTALPLDYCLPENAEVHLENQEEALRLGVVPRMIYDFSATETLKLEQNPEKLKSYMGFNANFKGTEDERALERIAQKDEIDIILPLDSIEKFVNGIKLSWNILFRIQESGLKKLCIVESPLPPLNMDTKHRNAEILTYSFEMEVLEESLQESPLLETPNVSETVTENSETFSKFPKDLDSDSDDEGQLIIDESVEEELTEETQSATQEAHKDSTPEKILNIPSPVKSRRRAQNSVFRKCSLTSGKEVCRILVKFHQDGVVLGDDGEEAINFSLKIEYQTEFGAEEMTIEELIREWCQQTFNPNSRTLRIRIDFQTLKILSVKEISLKDIEKDLQRLHGISSKKLLQRLWGILSVMKNFPVQNYLMHHESVHDKKVKIYASRETGEHDKNFLQLSQLFAKVDFRRKPLLEQHDWIPIDDQEVTILHEQKNVMPCAFPHWGKAESVNIWNEKKNLIEKYEARMKAKTEAKLLQERKIKSEKNRKKKLKRQQVKQQKAKEKSEEFAKKLAQSGDITVPSWFFDEDGRVKVNKDST
ncbi:uncharacterized protein LOC129800857 [Phlebotomus papatasi]|uniref:uncharacterized protein LOC129800857 n=1 Tax=Phlebotomus papatasi TaxID=29031 RepID=UPI0024841ED0|nr:uncharacterized protein LOC129800857 [Phlebotomus papatasi]